MTRIEEMEAEQLDIFISDYNWGDGFHEPQMVIDNRKCQLATAIKTFYLADGYAYLLQNTSENAKWVQFISGLYEKILTGCFLRGNLSYKIPLTRTQIYKLKKNNVSEVFLKDIL